MHKLRCYVGNNGDYAESTQRKDWNDLIIISGVKFNIAVTQIHNLCHVAEIAGSFLNANDIVYVLYQRCDRGRCHSTSGTAWYIVKDRRNGNFLCNRCVVGDQTILGCLVIIWCHKQNTVCSSRLCLFAKLDSSCCTVGAGTGDHRDTSLDTVDRKTDGIYMLFLRHGSRLTGCTTDNDRIGLSGNLFLQKFVQFIEINLVIFLHWCN